MIEIFPNLYISAGGEADTLRASGTDGPPAGWYVISAAKHPWHKDAVGYTGNAAPKTMIENGVEMAHPEYLIARRTRRLILNLIDAPDPAYIPEEIMVTAIEAIDQALATGDKVLVHCNQGQSRAPMIGLLWLRYSKFAGPFIKRLSFDDAMAAYAELYPPLSPGDGMRAFVAARWE
jgi:hypothetical protein